MHGRSRTDDPRRAPPETDVDEPREHHRPPPGLALDPPDDPPPEHPPEIPTDRLDPEALKVIARLRHMRHKAYFVGGCVRDLLLEKTPKDFDIATDAHPGEVRAIFRNCRLIGRRFRLAHVYFRGGKVIEVATFRKNPTDVAEDLPDGGDLLITRDNVFGTAEEDAVRRDFTVNGLFYDVARGEVLDYVGGRADLEAHRIATIGDPEIRMREDPVRALRAVRFAARLGFIISPDTFEAMRRHAGELARCAPARVLEEIFKILRCGGSARAFELLRACGALPVVLPSLGAALDSWDDGRRRSFFAHLAALDRLVRSGEEVSEAVLLGALLMHLGARPGQATPAPAGPGRRPPRPDESEALLASLVQTARLPRKIAERARLALHGQKVFRDPPRKRRRRGRGGAGAQHADALQLLRISVEATGEGREVLERFGAEEDEGHGHGGRGRAARNVEDAEHGEELERAEHPKDAKDAGHGGRGGRREQTERREHAERRERPEHAEHADRAERTERSARADRADHRAERGEHAERPQHPERRAARGGGREEAPAGRETHSHREVPAYREVAAYRDDAGPDAPDEHEVVVASREGETGRGEAAAGGSGPDGQPGGRKRRRRRGGRRRRRRGAGATAGDGGAGAPVSS